MDAVLLNKLFLKNLNRAYCVNSHLTERFSEIKEQEYFSDIKPVLVMAWQRSEKQTSRMEMLYHLLDANHSFTLCQDLITLLENAFEQIVDADMDLYSRDVAIFFYLNMVDSTDQTVLKLLDMMAPKISNPMINNLLLKCRNETALNRMLINTLLVSQLNR